jgi:hypothetical protein
MPGMPLETWQFEGFIINLPLPIASSTAGKQPVASSYRRSPTLPATISQPRQPNQSSKLQSGLFLKLSSICS